MLMSVAESVYNSLPFSEHSPDPVNIYDSITQEIDDSPKGPGTIAFFDLDGTLIFGFSILSIFRERVMSGDLAPYDAMQQFFSLLSHGLNGTEYPRILAEAAETLEGVSEQDFIELGESVFEKYVAGSIYPESRALVRAHLKRGHQVVVLSSATTYQVSPVARELGIRHVLCNEFDVEDGVFTGEIRQPVYYAEGKLDAAKEFCLQHNGTLEKSYFYSDGIEDVTLLDAVGFPRPLNPDQTLDVVARRRNWPIRRFSSRGIPGIKEFVRTGLVYGAFFSAALQIIPTWILNQSRRDAVNLAVTTWGEFGSALAGIKIDIRGEHHLWEQRPAIFLFNHQSAIDVLIIAKLLRRDFTAIAKHEIATNPLVGPVFRVADTVFIDRRNQAKAIEALKPVVKTLQDGLSIAIAPEGTRSVGDRLGPFKKGPFHIAMQAGVPVIPIVIHNATDVLPKGGFFVRPSTVFVDVLPPLQTDSWLAETVDQHVAEVREQFLEVLDQTTRPAAKLKRVK
jgi:putative phosphoserine phosphatase/1-acylglycerol-3-phosphate O-acyltransferase